MRGSLTKLAASVAALTALVVGGSTLASAAPHAKVHATVGHSSRAHATTLHHAGGSTARAKRDNPGESESTASDSDGAGQAAACQKAGIDPNADNVQYDDQTGTCTLDTGGNSQQ